MDRKPLHTARSVWRTAAPTPEVVAILESAGADEISVAYRNVHDGSLRVLLANEPAGWHLSISHVDHQGRPRRYPTWDEIADARDVFLPATLGFVMHLPKADEYVAVHVTSFHLHQHPAPDRVITDVRLESVAVVAEPLRPKWTVATEDDGDVA